MTCEFDRTHNIALQDHSLGNLGKTSGINMYVSNFIKMLVYESCLTHKKTFT